MAQNEEEDDTVDFNHQSDLMDEMLELPGDMQVPEEELRSEEESNEEEAVENSETPNVDDSNFDEVTNENDEPEGENVSTPTEEEDTVTKPVVPNASEASLREEITRLSTLLAERGNVPAQVSTAQEGSNAEPQPATQELTFAATEPIEFVKTPAELAALFQSPDGMNKLLNMVVDANRQFSLQAMPNLIATTVARQMTTQTAVADFWQKNPDLKPFEKYAGVVYGELEAANAGKTPQELMDMTADTVRARLSIAKQAQEIETERRATNRKPAFAPTTPARTSTSSPRTGPATQREQINDLLK